MKAVILAAGKGTRLLPVTEYIPKPLLPIANRPTLEYAFDRIRELGIYEVCIVVGENAPALQQALGDGNAFGLNLHYALQPEPKGLAHALSFAQPFLKTDPFLLYLGDAIYTESLLPLKQRFEETECANLSMVKEVEDPSRFGVAELQEERIVHLEEKPLHPRSRYAMAGIYFFNPQIWRVLPRLQPSPRGEYEITDAIQLLIEEGETVLAGRYEGEWFDTGTLPSFLECSRFLLNQGVLLGKEAILHARTGAHVCIGEGAYVSCEYLEDSVILPHARVEVRGEIRHCLIGGHVQREGSLSGKILYGEKES